MLRASCLAADNPNKVKEHLLITGYWVLMVSYVASGGEGRQSNYCWTGKSLLADCP